MTVTDRLRTAREGFTSAPDGARPRLTALLLDTAYGVATAAVSLVLTMLVALAAWAAPSEPSVEVGRVLGTAADGWLLAHGARIDLGAGSLAFTPILLWLLLVGLVRVGAARMLRRLDDDGDPTGPVSRYAVGYAVVGALGWLLTGVSAARPVWWTVPPALVLTVGVGLAWAWYVTANEVGAEPPALISRLPLVVRRGIPVAWYGLAVGLVAGSLLVLAMVAVQIGQVAHVSGQLKTGAVGAGTLWLGQLSALPNLGLWALSFTAGSGYHVVAGASTTWAGAHSGLLPLFPVLAATPSPGAFGWYVPILVVVPVAVGWLVGRRALDAVARLSSWRTKAQTALTATTLTALLLGAADALGGGSLGAHRLADIGAPALTMTGLLVVEFGLGALACVAVDVRSLRRR